MVRKVVKNAIRRSNATKTIAKFDISLVEVFPGSCKQEYLPRGVEESVVSTVKKSGCVVDVLVGAKGSGKTCFVKRIANMLYEQGDVQGICYIDDYRRACCYNTLNEWITKDAFELENVTCLCDPITPSEDSTKQIPYLLVLDNFGDALCFNHALQFINTISNTINSTSKMRIICVVDNEAQYMSIKSFNGGVHIRRITQDTTMSDEVIRKFAFDFCKWDSWPDKHAESDTMDKILSTRNPGFVVFAKSCPVLASQLDLLDGYITAKHTEMGSIKDSSGRYCIIC